MTDATDNQGITPNYLANTSPVESKHITPPTPDSEILDDFIEIVPDLGAPKLYLTQREYDFLQAWRNKAVLAARKEQLMQDFLSLNVEGLGAEDEAMLIQWREQQDAALNQEKP